MSLLEIKNLTKIYQNQAVLKDVSLEVEDNQIIGLLGPNGSGKTTLIKLINGLIQPTTGKIYIHGKLMEPYLKKHISFLPERSYLDMNQTVNSALKMFDDIFDDFIIEDAKHIIELFKIPLNKRLSQLSKGQKGKVQLGLVFGRKTDLYILDEPLDGVDPASRDFIMKIIKKYKKDQSTVILSTHQVADIEDQIDGVILLKEGALIEAGPISILEKKYQMTLGKYFKEVYRYDEKTI